MKTFPRRRRRVLLVLGILRICVLGLQAAEEDSLEEFALEGIRVDLERRVVRLAGTLCLREGILEYVAVSRGGKTYESLFELEAEPSQIHASLLLVGLEPEVAKAGGKEAETPLRIAVEWLEGEDGGAVKDKVPMEALLTDRAHGEKAGTLTWVFTGSILGPNIDTKEEGDTIYVADLERSVIAIWPDQTAVLNPVQNSRNPYRGDTYGFEARKASLPEVGAKAWLVLGPVLGP